MAQIYKNQPNRQNKRRLATPDGVKLDLHEELPMMFTAFSEACSLYHKEILLTPPQARARGFEAQLLNSKMIQCAQKYFSDQWKFAKYRRFVVRVNGYNVLFKKLNGKNMPMNVKTHQVEAITNQLSLPLFETADFTADPILFFGYRKNSVGNIFDPKLVYIDEDMVKWVVTQSDLGDVKPQITLSKSPKGPADLKLRNNVAKKKSS